VFRSVLNILRSLLRADGGINFLLVNYHSLSLLKTSLENFDSSSVYESEARDRVGWQPTGDGKASLQELNSRFLAQMLGNRPFKEVSLAEVAPFSKFTVDLLDSLRDLTNLLNRFFASLYALSDDQSLIAYLSGLAQGITATEFSPRVFHFMVSQNRMLSSLLVIIKLKTQDELQSMKFEVGIMLDILWNSRTISRSAVGRRRQTQP
jgi:hypothetical protein